jgi:hypothetical protein
MQASFHVSERSHGIRQWTYPEEGDKFVQFRYHIDTLLAIYLENGDGSGKEALEAGGNRELSGEM